MEKMGEVSKAASEKVLPKLKAALTADQLTRLQQINWQVMGSAAYTDAEVVKAINITSDQQEKLKAVNTSIDEKQRALMSEGFGGGNREETREKFQAIGKEREAKTEEVLTKDQIDKFALLKGKKFDVTQLGQFGRGGPGGGGGGAPRGKRPQPKAE